MDSDFSRSEMNNASFKAVHFLRTSFSRANLSLAQFDDIFSTAEINFTLANLTEAVFQNSRLQDAKFIEANLTGATIGSNTSVNSFVGADLRSANLAGMAKFLSLKVKDAKFDASTQLPPELTKEMAIARGMIFVE